MQTLHLTTLKRYTEGQQRAWMTGEDSSISCDGLEKRRASGFKAPKAKGLFWFPQPEDKVTGKQVKPPARHWRLSSQNIGNESYRKGDETHTSAEKRKEKLNCDTRFIDNQEDTEQNKNKSVFRASALWRQESRALIKELSSWCLQAALQMFGWKKPVG